MTETIATDMYTSAKVVRPNKAATIKFDFDFKKKVSDTWIYANSCDNVNAFKDQIDAVVGRGGEFRIVEAATGKIVKSG
jgi:hypothetical protein